jgi:hypothetical protein
MSHFIKKIDLEKIKSKWVEDIITEWQPDKGYIEHLKKQIADKEYLPPIVVVKEGNFYYIVNGHHRYYPLRKAEVLLKEFDQKTEYRYQFSGYLDRWAAAAEEQGFINKYRPTYKFRLYKFLKKIKNKWFK